MYKMKEFYVLMIEDDDEYRYLSGIDVMDYDTEMNIEDAIQFEQFGHAYRIAHYLNYTYNTKFEVIQVSFERKSTFTEGSQNE